MNDSEHVAALHKLQNFHRLRIASASWEGEELTVTGTLFMAGSELEVQGGNVVSMEFGMERAELVEVYQDQAALNSGFRLVLRRDRETEDRYWPGYIMIRPAACSEPNERIANTWAFPAQEIKVITPGPQNICRVIGTSDPQSYAFGGATHAVRMIAALSLLAPTAAGSNPSDLMAIDWGCGSGRILQHLAHRLENITGADVDPVNIDWCQRNLNDLRTTQIDWTPPSPFGDREFDLLFSFSVFSHIHHSRIDLWLGELARIMRPGGKLVITTLGVVSTASRRAKPQFFEDLAKKGFLEWPNNGQIDDVRPTPDDYLNIAMSKEYAAKVFARHFRVLGAVEGLGPQDAWVLQRD